MSEHASELAQDAEWVSHYPAPHRFDARIHTKDLFPSAAMVRRLAAEEHPFAICAGDLGLPVRTVQGERGPPPRPVRGVAVLRDAARRDFEREAAAERRRELLEGLRARPAR